MALMLKPVLVQREIDYECGCRGQFPIIGQFSERNEWHVIPCFEHTKQLEELEKRLDADWKLIHNGKL